MIKSYLLLIVFVSFTGFAQNKFGVFSGITYSYLAEGFSKKVNTDDAIGLQIGIVYQTELTKKISFRPKLVYSQQGDRKASKGYSPYTLDISQIDYKLNYLNAPLDFKFWNKIYVIAGPQIGYLLSTEKGDINFGEPKSKFDLGFNLGGGFTVNRLFFELGFYHGVTTVLEFPNRRYIADIKNGVGKFTVGYSFN